MALASGGGSLRARRGKDDDKESGDGDDDSGDGDDDNSGDGETYDPYGTESIKGPVHQTRSKSIEANSYAIMRPVSFDPHQPQAA